MPVNTPLHFLVQFTLVTILPKPISPFHTLHQTNQRYPHNIAPDPFPCKPFAIHFSSNVLERVETTTRRLLVPLGQRSLAIDLSRLKRHHQDHDTNLLRKSDLWSQMPWRPHPLQFVLHPVPFPMHSQVRFERFLLPSVQHSVRFPLPSRIRYLLSRTASGQWFWSRLLVRVVGVRRFTVEAVPKGACTHRAV